MGILSLSQSQSSIIDDEDAIFYAMPEMDKHKMINDENIEWSESKQSEIAHFIQQTDSKMDQLVISLVHQIQSGKSSALPSPSRSGDRSPVFQMVARSVSVNIQSTKNKKTSSELPSFNK